MSWFILSTYLFIYLQEWKGRGDLLTKSPFSLNLALICDVFGHLYPSPMGLKVMQR